ncbi:hypothetical protein [Paraflavitalea speifideaquila]|uniref:hypothetical protein n=1 Tax=Paraflavitalea speifideaquila TaxID=3076558 RepID=UPI0028E54B71|nr:hypothetical protein [Paraflavitalea speifideiaquila]
MKNFELTNTTLEINQGFAYLTATGTNNEHNEQLNQVNSILKAKEAELQTLRTQFDTIQQFNAQGRQLFDELKIQYPDIDSLLIGSGNAVKDNSALPGQWVALYFTRKNYPPIRSKWKAG